jgi:hypothetical protein
MADVYRPATGKRVVNAVHGAFLTLAIVGERQERPAHGRGSAAHLSPPLRTPMKAAVKPGKSGAPPVLRSTSPTCRRAIAAHRRRRPCRRLPAGSADAQAQAPRPTLMRGNGCREAPHDRAMLDTWTRFEESRGIPAITTADGKGLHQPAGQTAGRGAALAREEVDGVRPWARSMASRSR